jgi:hypothetical protein
MMGSHILLYCFYEGLERLWIYLLLVSAYHYRRRRRRRKIYIYLYSLSTQESTLARYSVHPAPSFKRSRRIHQETPQNLEELVRSQPELELERGAQDGKSQEGYLCPSCSPRGLESTHARKRQALFARLIFLNYNMAQIQTGMKGVNRQSVLLYELR